MSVRAAFLALWITPFVARADSTLAAQVAALRTQPTVAGAKALLKSGLEAPRLREAIALEAAVAALAAGDASWAAKQARPLEKHPAWGHRARWVAAQAGAGKCKDRLATVTALADDPPWIEKAPRLSLLRKLHHSCGEALVSEQLQRTLALDHPTTAEGVAALKGLTLEPDDQMRRAASLVKGRHYAEADAIYAALEAGPQRWPALMARARLRLAPWRRDYAQAHRWFLTIAEAKDPEARLLEEEARHLAARAAGRAGLSETAAHYTDYLERYPEGQFRQEAIFFQAFGAYEAGRYLEAAAGFARVQGAQWGGAAQWYHAWSLYLGGHGEAVAALRALAQSPGRHQRAARYWTFRASLASSPEAAKQGLKALAAESPLDWYGLLVRLQWPELAPPLVMEPLKAPEEGALTPLEQDLQALVQAGLHDYALRRLDVEAPALRRDGQWDQLYRLVSVAGDAQRARRLSLIRNPDLLTTGATEEGAQAFHRAHPRPWSETVDRAARATGLEGEVIWSIMWMESGFDHDVVSRAHARGLMQLLDRTAAKIQRHRNAPTVEAPDLFDPAVNIDLGAWYLAALRDRFEGQVPLYVAAYNAGPKAVDQWLDQLTTAFEIHGDAGVPIDLFVDRVPFRQARGYIKRFYRLYFMYRVLGGHGEPQRGLPTVVHDRRRPGVDF
ncbi:MAG: transglycosylase SLT domain-containing protein [Bradymonadia bacterium]